MKTDMPIYLDHHASTPIDSVVLREMLPYFAESFANPHSADHAAGWDADKAVQAARLKVSKSIGCDPDEIIFTSGATESNNFAILGLRRLFGTGHRNKIVTTNIEHKSVIDPCRVAAKEYGAVVQKCAVDNKGYLIEDDLKSKIDETVLVLSVGAVNGEIGTIQHIEQIYDLATRFGVLVHLDAAQMPMATDISNAARCADMISLSAHKMNGPKGVGCLYVRREIQSMLAPLIFGGGQQNNLRSGTLPVPLCVGMGAASELLSVRTNERVQLRMKTQKLWEKINALGFEVALNGPSIDDRHPGNLNVRFAGYQAEDILGGLQPHLAASTGSACTSGTPEISHVLDAIGLTEDEARSSIRFGVGCVTTDEEIVQAVELIGAALQRLECVGTRQQA